MSVRYLDLADYVAIAVEVTGLDAQTVMRVGRLALADAALHAPRSTLHSPESATPSSIQRSSTRPPFSLCVSAKNHPLPDGNKRAAWVALRLFIEMNGWTWKARPSVDDAERAVVAVAAGDWDHKLMGDWLRAHLMPLDPTTR